MMTIHDMEKSKDDHSNCKKYREVSVIHHGRSAIVCLATAEYSHENPTVSSSEVKLSRPTTRYAIKKIAIEGNFSDIIPRSYNSSIETKRKLLYCNREIEALQVLKGHPNVVELIHVTRTDFTIELVFIYCETNLHTLIHYEEWFTSSSSSIINNREEGEGSFDRIKQCCRMILQGLGHCHANSIVHRDIKPFNILMDSQGVFKLADFGQARTISITANQCEINDNDDDDDDKMNDDGQHNHQAPLTAQIGSRYYRAPELIFGSTNYNESIDIWSFGCVLAEICSRKILFPGNSDIEQLMLIVEAIGEAPSANFNGSYMEDFNKIIIESARSREDSLENLKQNVLMPSIGHNDCVDLITKLCTYENRLNVEQALDHDFLKN